MWIPKLAILEGLPEGWKEVRNADGSVHYLDTLTNTPSDEHPLDKHFLKLLQHERGKRKPTMSLQPELYEWQPEVAFESEIAPEKQKDKWFFRTVEKMAASGNHIGYFDAFGQQRWYDPVTKTETDVTHEVKILPAVITLQRFWRSYCVRKEIWVLHHAACVIGRAIKNRRAILKGKHPEGREYTGEVKRPYSHSPQEVEIFAFTGQGSRHSHSGPTGRCAGGRAPQGRARCAGP